MTPAELATAHKSGKSFIQIATEQGITQNQLNQFVVAQKQIEIDNLTASLTAAVASGNITQAQMNKRLANI